MDVAKFGCTRCMPDDAERAWNERELDTTDRLVEESHLHLTLARCPACGQQWLWCFTEVIDWEDGDDAQRWDLVPLTAEEAQRLRTLGEKADGSAIAALYIARRHLVRNFPTGLTPKVYWSSGVFLVPPHD